MNPLKNENEGVSTTKSTIKYTFVAPGAIAKGRGKGLKSLSSSRVSSATVPFSSCIDPMIRQYSQVSETKKGREQEQGIKRMSTVQEMQAMNKKILVKGNMQSSIPSFSSTEEVVQYIQTVGIAGDPQKEQQLGDVCSSKHVNSGSTKTAIEEIQMLNKRNLVHEEDYVPVVVPTSLPPYQLTQSIRTVGTSDLRKKRGLIDVDTFEDAQNDEGFFHQNAHHTSQSMTRPSKSTKPNSTMSATQGQRSAAHGLGYASQELPLLKKKVLVSEEEHVQEDISVSPPANQFMLSTQEDRASSEIPGNTHRMRVVNKQSLVHDKEHLRTEVARSPSADRFILSTQKSGASSEIPGNTHRMRIVNKQSLVHDKEHLRAEVARSPFNSHSMPSYQTTGSSENLGNTQGIQIVNKQSLVHDKEHAQADVPRSPSTGQAMPSYQTTGSSEIPRKVQKVRGSNKCKEVASLEVGQKLKVTFFNNRTVGKNSNLFSRHLGKIVRDLNMCPLAVSSWKDIKEEKLNHMWTVVKDKFESDDMDIHRDHIFSWMNELWNRWRGVLYAKYVKGRPIQEAIKNVPKGIDKRQWEWLVKEHFSTEKFQARSQRNSINRAKLKMLPRVGSKPIRELVYQKGGKYGNPPKFSTVFFESRKLNDALAEIETIEKHAQIQELMQSEPSLSSIEVVEKCFGPQRSHVLGFGGGVTAKDLKGGTTSKANLWCELRSSREENQSLKDRLSNMEK